jgi:hypothetical protein
MSASVGHDVVVAGEDDRVAALGERARVAEQALEPGQLVVELGARLRVAVGQVDRGDEHAVDGGLDVARVVVGVVARKRSPRHDRPVSRASSATPFHVFCPTRRAVAGVFERGARELGVGRLQLLQRDDIGLGLRQPLEQERQAAVDAVDVPGRDLQRRRSRRGRRKRKARRTATPAPSVAQRRPRRRGRRCGRGGIARVGRHRLAAPVGSVRCVPARSFRASTLLAARLGDAATLRIEPSVLARRPR